MIPQLQAASAVGGNLTPVGDVSDALAVLQSSYPMV